MYMNPEIQRLKHHLSSLQKKSNKMRDRCNQYREANDLKKNRLRQLSTFLDWLIKTKRITKEDIKRFFPKKVNTASPPKTD